MPGLVSSGQRAEAKSATGTLHWHGRNEENVHQILIRLVYASVAELAIIPLQDVLGLDESSRLNTPATTGRNWLWRLLGQLTSDIETQLTEWTTVYHRY